MRKLFCILLLLPLAANAITPIYQANLDTAATVAGSIVINVGNAAPAGQGTLTMYFPTVTDAQAAAQAISPQYPGITVYSTPSFDPALFAKWVSNKDGVLTTTCIVTVARSFYAYVQAKGDTNLLDPFTAPLTDSWFWSWPTFGTRPAGLHPWCKQQ